jgi:sirohydrochlorin cobaltochelatase
MTTQAIILIDHGSADEAGHDALTHLAAVVSARVGLAVYPAHMSLAPPTLADALAAAIADGADDVIVAPCFLGTGRHVTGTIPDLIAQAAATHPNVTVHLTESLGFDAALAEPIVTRIRPHIRPRELP